MRVGVGKEGSTKRGGRGWRSGTVEHGGVGRTVGSGVGGCSAFVARLRRPAILQKSCWWGFFWLLGGWHEMRRAGALVTLVARKTKLSLE